MDRKPTRIGIAALVLAGTAIAASALPGGTHNVALTGHERIFTYYNNAQHSVVVGQVYIGVCDTGANWGTTSAYSTLATSTCQISN